MSTVGSSSSSSPAINFAGISSGIDTNSIVSELMSLARNPEVLMKRSISITTVKENALKDLSTRLTNLKNAAQAISDLTLFNKTSQVSVSDSSSLTANADATTPPVPGAYTVVATQLAHDDVWTQSSSITQASNSDTIALTLTTQKGATTKNINVNSGDDINTIAANINSQNMGITAAVVNGQLRLNGAGTISMTGGNQGNGYNVVTDLGMAETQTHQVSLFSVDGKNYTEDSNSITDAISGVDFTMTKSGATTTINVSSPAANADDITKKVQDFVTQYNSTLDFIRQKVTEQKVIPPKTESDYTLGVMNSDPMLTRIMNDMRGKVSQALTGADPNFSMLSQIGISTAAANSSGNYDATAITGDLTFDATKFKNALLSNPDQVKALLQQNGTSDDTDGIAQRLQNMISPYTDAGGIIDTSTQGYDSSIKETNRQIDAFEARLAIQQQTLTAQFNAMETFMSKMQAQGGQLGAMSSGLKTSSTSGH